MLIWILAAIWLTISLVTIYPLYCAMVGIKKRTYHTVEAEDVVANALFATFVSVAWPVAMPFLVSYWLHRRRIFPGAVEEADRVQEISDEYQVQRTRMKQAALEVSHAETAGLDPWPDMTVRSRRSPWA